MIDRSKEFKCYRRILGRLVGLLPEKSRELYGRELVQIYENDLIESLEKSGMPLVRRKMPALVADACTAVCLEYIDVWRGARVCPVRTAILALVGSGAVWSLVAAASIGDVGWAAALLEINLPVTLTLMLGLPVMSLVASRVGSGPGRPHEARSVFRSSVSATVVAWSILTCHIVA